MHKEAAIVFTHGSHSLAEVKKKTSLNVLHDDEHQVRDNTAWRFHDLSCISKVYHFDNSGMLKVLQYSDFILHWKNRIFITSEEFLLQYLDSEFVVGCCDLSG